MDSVSVQIDKRLGHFSIKRNVGKWKSKIFSIPMVHELLGGSAANGKTRLSVERNSMDSRSSAGNAVTNTEHKHRITKSSPGRPLVSLGMRKY